MNYFIECVTNKYICFSGRAHRTEYWSFVLVQFLLSFAIGFILGVLQLPENAILNLINIWTLVLLLPGLAVTVRRLHDINLSGWFVLTAVIPIILLVLTVIEGTRGSNYYGPSPK